VNLTPPSSVAVPYGESIHVPERVIVAPVVGVFRPAPVGAGTTLRPGDEIGRLEGPGMSTPVHSPFGGTLVGMLAHPGERLRAGQPVAWLRVA
jgi:biotin carboxyl carrier protein